MSSLLLLYAIFSKDHLNLVFFSTCIEWPLTKRLSKTDFLAYYELHQPHIMALYRLKKKKVDVKISAIEKKLIGIILF